MFVKIFAGCCFCLPLLAQEGICPWSTSQRSGEVGQLQVDGQAADTISEKAWHQSLDKIFAENLPAPPDAYAWLLQMIFAIENLEYRGQLIYRHEQRLESLMLKQIRDTSGRYQTFSLAEGAPGAPQSWQSVQAFTADRLPGLRQLLADPTLTPKALKARLAERLSAYRVRLTEVSGVIAQKSTKRLSLLPKDNYRFGYLLDLDQNNGMLLRLQLLDSNQTVLEELFFTYIHYFSCSEEKAEEKAEETVILDQPPAASARSCPPPSWAPAEILGFYLLSSRQLTTTPPAKQLVYSDGLAMISVFLRHPRPKPEVSGFFRLSVLHGYHGQVGTETLLIIGAVPLVTIEVFQQFFALQLLEEK